ncbi:MAG: hypothetical protein EBR02_06590 [Alphaproteobacteria bacterium]|nr:hypothetical protein [Alphaproteobacteria bacterium]
MADEKITPTFLTERQIWCDDQGNGQLQVMKDYGTKAGMSDLAVVLGGAVSSTDKANDGQRSGYLWSASSIGAGNVRTVNSLGVQSSYVPIRRDDGARPALPSSVASTIKASEAKPSRKILGEANTEIEIVEYGEYPQSIAPEAVSVDLEKAFKERKLQKTGKKYTFDGEKSDAYDKPFKSDEHVEYQHNGKKYIRVEARPCDDDSVLSNGKKLKAGEPCWVEVQPIEWLKDPTGVMVARQALFSGVQFDTNEKYDGKFENTAMYRYLQDHFAKEMVAKAIPVATIQVKEEKPAATPPADKAAADNAAEDKKKKDADKGFFEKDGMMGGLIAGAIALVVGMFTQLGVIGTLLLAAVAGVAAFAFTGGSFGGGESKKPGANPGGENKPEKGQGKVKELSADTLTAVKEQFVKADVKLQRDMTSAEIRELAGKDGILQAEEIRNGAEKYKVKEAVVPDISRIQVNLKAANQEKGIVLK